MLPGGKGGPRPVSTNQKILFLFLGLATGYIGGTVLMDTAGTIFITGAKNGSFIHISSETKTEEVASPKPTAAVATLTEAKPAGNTVHTIVTGNGSPYQNYQTRIIDDKKQETAAAGTVKSNWEPEWAGDTIHTIFTSGGDGYQNYQSRILYATYNLIQQQPGGERHTGFTRILHRMKDDELMDQIPTFRANPLHPECDKYCDFPVADRANAVQQWIDAVRAGKQRVNGAWVLLIEADYVFMKPVPVADAYSNAPSVQFHFDYIQPDHPDCAHIIKRLYNNGNPSEVPASGPAPVLLRFKELMRLVPEWERVTAMIEADKEAVKKLDWVREMYAWDVAVALLKDEIKMDTQDPPNSILIVQPPHDITLGNASMCHYTWGTIYKEGGKEIWKWDKRDFWDQRIALKVPGIVLPPPWRQGLKLQDDYDISESLHNTLVAMLTQMNRGIANLPDLTARVFKPPARRLAA